MSRLTLKQAVRVFHRIYSPIADLREEAETCDAGFDGGEYSGPWHAKEAEKEFFSTVRKVAVRCGVDPDALLDAICAGMYAIIEGGRS